jgi:hypothetical protein
MEGNKQGRVTLRPFKRTASTIKGTASKGRVTLRPIDGGRERVRAWGPERHFGVCVCV